MYGAPGLGKGAKSRKAKVPVEPKSKTLDPIRESFPELKEATDAQVMEFLEKKNSEAKVNDSAAPSEPIPDVAGKAAEQAGIKTGGELPETIPDTRTAIKEAAELTLETSQMEAARVGTKQDTIAYEPPASVVEGIIKSRENPAPAQAKARQNLAV
jgi:hypothetical protein